MTALAMAYVGLPDIDQTTPLDSSDMKCFEAIRDVLKAHGKLDRFGVSLLHSHFPIRENEVLVEYCDDNERKLTMHVRPRSEFDKSEIVETMWRLSDGDVVLGCSRACVAAGGTHKSRHVQTR